jgi:GH43 family beta-xylosidase
MDRPMKLLLALLALVLASACSQFAPGRDAGAEPLRRTATAPGMPVAAPPSPSHFANPIVRAASMAGSADPSVVYRDGAYWYCRSLADGAVGVARAERLQDIGSAPITTVWRPEPGSAQSRQVWAPELQVIAGRWWIYVAASDGRNETHRMFVLEAEGDDPRSGFRLRGRLDPDVDSWAIDGVAFEARGKLYFVWSGWRGPGDGFPQVLYIAEMRNPWTLAGPRHEIAAPDRAWERGGAPLLEAPAVLQRNGRIHIVYSASGSWTDDYTLGMLTHDGGDILDAASWRKSAQPVFSAKPGSGVFGAGHNGFFRSPDGRDDWIVYHAIDRAGGGWALRSVRAQPFRWSDDGMPDFGHPVGAGIELDAPSGEAVAPVH